MVKDRRFRHLETKVGLLVALAFLGLVLIVAFIGIEQDVFVQKFNVRFTVDRATGFSEGMPVKLSGFRIGRLKSLDLADDARVNVILQIQKPYQKWLRQDSRVKLVKEGVIGENIVEALVGSPNLPMLEDGSSIVYEKTATLDDLLEEIKREVTPVLFQLKSLVAYLDNPEGEVKSTLHNVEQFTAGLIETQNRMNRLIESARANLNGIESRTGRVLDTANQRLEDLSPPIGSATRIAGVVEERLPETLVKLDRLLVELGVVSERLNRMVEASSSDVPDLLREARRAVETSREVVDSVKQIWPVSSNIEEKPTLVPGRGYEPAAPDKGGAPGAP